MLWAKRLFRPPGMLLRGYISGADDADMGVHEKKCENLPVTRFS